MSVHSAEQAPVPAPPRLTEPMSETDAVPVSAGETPTLKKKKKLLNGANIKFTFPSGATYEGSFKDGRIEGYGVYTYAKTGDVYEGEWKADHKHGHGSYIFANGDRYLGQWYMGQKHGRGQFVFANGDEYVGSWRENQMCGYGVFTLAANDNCYKGYWNDGLREGQGILYYSNGDLYDGEWNCGHEEGLGIFCQSNDDLYCGYWKEGVKDGKGVLGEKGILFLVEYTGDYLISKQKQCDALAETEKEWASVYRHYLAWVGHQEAQHVPRRSKEEEDKLRNELQAVVAENSILRKRLEDIFALHWPKGRSGNADGESPSSSRCASLQEAGEAHWRESVQKLESKIKLLECTLAERIVEVRKLADQLKSSGAKVHELELKSAAHKLTLHNAKRDSAKKTPEHEAPAPAVQMSPTEIDFIDAEEVEKLQEKSALLSKLNEELQQKVAFLTAENVKLALKEEAIEDQYDKLSEEMTELRNALEHEHRAKANSQPLESRDTAAASAASNTTTVNVSALVSPAPASEMEENYQELQQKLIQANQLNIELRLKVGDLERVAQATEKETGQFSSTREAARLAHENEVLRSLVTSLKEQLVALQSASSDTEQQVTLAYQRQVELQKAMEIITHRKAANPQLQETLEQKFDQIEKLELENAELARLLDETRADLEEKPAVALKAKRQPADESLTVGGAPGELVSLQKDLKKLQKRIRRLADERNSLAEQFYQSQVRLARTDRAMGSLKGQVVVFASISDTSNVDTPMVDPATRVDVADPTTLVLRDCGVETVHHYDYCFDKNSSAEQICAELCDPLAFVWSGYQFALLTVGELRSGKSTLVREILPLLTKHLSKAAAESPNRSSFHFTYRVAVVEISTRGGFDCASEDDVTEVSCDANGFVQPKNVRFIDCTSCSILNVVDNLLVKRRQHYNGRSHTWIQLQCVRTSAVRQCQTVGRLTIFDWCGGGSVASQKTDIESARFANTSNQMLRDLVTALASKLPVIPYTRSVEASLLFDLLGGNSMTAVVGRVRSSIEHVEETVRTLHVLTSLYGMRNGPLLPDNQGSDEIRWRGIIAALCSEYQAERELKPVESIREA
ncbi:hypothetical protein JKF63_03979 [Porcisia hertigi]|uniref:Kinesin motor domain-containing protein n=1 Tax=Porcisia hertigi TaxID=2761500 RepID=A0A836IM27_9TRYP|nr:hypothetical protein JKF63_03979 [Porcisia hertigi]